MCTFVSFRCIHFIGSCYLDKYPSLSEQFFWYESPSEGYLKLKRLTLALHHNKFTYLDYSVFSTFFIYIYIYIYIYYKNNLSSSEFNILDLIF